MQRHQADFCAIANQQKDKKGKDVVVVRGEIANSGRAPAPVPSLSVSLVDERGWVMYSSTVESTGALWRNIGAGKSKAFVVEVRPAPELLKTAVVTFAAKHAAEPRLGVGVFCSGVLPSPSDGFGISDGGIRPLFPPRQKFPPVRGAPG